MTVDLDRQAREDALRRYLEHHGERAAETAWLAALTMIERAAHDAREGQWSRWRSYPRGELRRLRRDLAAALELARLAATVQQTGNDRDREQLNIADALHARAAHRPSSEETRQRTRARLATLAAKRRIGRRLEPWEEANDQDYAAADRRLRELDRCRSARDRS